MKGFRYLFVGIVFGIVLTKSQVNSWFRIVEMFKFQSFHMFGIISVGIVMSALGLFLIKKFKVKDVDGNPMTIIKKPMGKNYILGGIIFGAGWALSGTCPGPMYANIGVGYPSFIIMWIMATLGTFTYGIIKDKLPH